MYTLKFVFIVKRCQNTPTHMVCMVVDAFDGGRMIKRSKPFIVSDMTELGGLRRPPEGVEIYQS